MSDWSELALIIAVAAPIGLGLRFYLRYLRGRHNAQVERIDRVGRSMSWPYYAAATIFCLTLAVSSVEQRPSLLLISTAAALQLVATVRVFIRERSQFSLRHLLIAVTVFAILAALFRWFGMAMVVVLGVAAAGAMLLLAALEWFRHRSRPQDDERRVRDMPPGSEPSPQSANRTSMPGKWFKSMFLVCVALIGIVAALLGARAYSFSHLRPPPGVDDLHAFAQRMPPPTQLYLTWDKRHIVWIGGSSRPPIPASGPACYVFDATGNLVDWCDETDQGHSVDRFYRRRRLAEPMTLDEAFDFVAPTAAQK